MKKLMFVPLLFAACVFAVNSAQAQEGKKYDNPQWKNVVFVDYHSGKMQRAHEIIDNYYVKASEKAGTPQPESVMVMHSGDWDMMVIWHMQGGIEDMNWERNPNGMKWFNAFKEIAGGEDKAQAILDEYDSLVARSSNQIARIRQ